MKTLLPNLLLVNDIYPKSKDDVDNRTNETVTLKDNPALSSPVGQTAGQQQQQQQQSPNNTTNTNIPMTTEMYREDVRLKTFDGKWPHLFLQPRILAKIGFYYIGPHDQVKCYFCKVEIGRWEAEDNEVTEHIRWSPNCPLLKRRETTNVAIEPTTELDQLLPPMSYDVCGPCGIDVRPGSYAESSFSSSPATPTTITTATNTTVERETQTLKHPDYPEYAIETARLRSFDDWPKTIKQKPKQLSDAGFFYTQKGDRVICFSCGGGLRDWDENDDPWEQHALWFSKCEYLKLVKGQEYIDAVKAKQNKLDAEKNGNASSSQESIKSSGSSTSAAAEAAQILAEKDDPHQDNKLCESRLCKICYCSEYNTAFFPCGHVVACTKCASSVTKCPLCRKPFEKVMRVFFS